MDNPVLAMWTPGLPEMVVIGAVALLIFGKRLPEIARSVGKSIVEFKRGLKDVRDVGDAQAKLSAPRDAVLEHKPEPVRPEPSDQPPPPPSNDVAVAGEPKRDD